MYYLQKMDTPSSILNWAISAFLLMLALPHALHIISDKKLALNIGPSNVAGLNEEVPPFPESFKTKLIFYHQVIGGGEEAEKIEEWYNNGVFRTKRELDEYYDSKRQLGKLVFRDTFGTVVELYARPLENYYIIHRVGLGCTINKFRSDEFQMFDYVTRLLPNRPHLFGPSAIINKWHAELETKKNEPAPKIRDANIRDYRLIESPSYTMMKEEPVGKNNATVTFTLKRAANPVKRSMGLSHYVTRVLIREQSEFVQYIEYISFDKMDSDDDQFKNDPFKLPTGIGCIPSDAGNYIGFDVGFKFSGYLTSSHNRAMRHFVALDGKSKLLRHDIHDHSKNVIDLDRFITYHMPYDIDMVTSTNPDINDGLKQQQQLSVDRYSEHHLNRECFILSTRNLFFRTEKTFDMLSSMQLLIGNSYMYYMGRSVLRGSLVHVFDRVLMANSEPLPFAFSLLARSPIDYIPSAETIANKRVRIYLTIYIAAKIGCDYYYEDSITHILSEKRRSAKFYDRECDKQIPVAVRAVRHNLDLDTYEIIDEINIYGASWLAHKSTEDPLNLFDIGRCPLNRIDLSSIVTWANNKIVTHSERIRTPSLAELTAQRVRKLFNASPIAVSGLAQRTRQTHTAEVSMSLLDWALFHAQYRLVSQRATRNEINDRLVSIKTGMSLLQCLLTSSQFEHVKSVLYIRPLIDNDEGQKDECLMFDGMNWNQFMEADTTNSDGQISSFSKESNNEPTSDNYLFFKTKESQQSYGKDFSMLELAELAESDNKILMHDVLLGDAVLNDDRAVQEAKILSTTLVNRQPLETFTRILKGYRYDDEADYRYFDGTISGEAPTNGMAMSLGRCMSECDQDSLCSSFAFCREEAENMCLISSIKDFEIAGDYQDNSTNSKKTSVEKPKIVNSLKLKLINDHKLQRDTNCEIHVKNYMKYFHLMRGSLQVEPIEQWRIYDQVEDSNRCARKCVEIGQMTKGQLDGTLNNDCILFLYCQRLHQCLVWLENPPITTSYIEDATKEDSDVEPSLEIVRKYNRFNCISYKYENKHLYVSVEERLMVATPFMVARHSMDSCAERCLFEHQCRSFDSCQMVLDKLNDDQVEVAAREDHQCRLYDVSIYDEGIHSLSDREIIEAMDQTQEDELVKELEQSGEKLSKRVCRHYERRQAYNKGKRTKEIELERMKSENSNLSNAFSVVAVTFIGMCLGLAIGTLIKKPKISRGDNRYKGSFESHRQIERRLQSDE